MGHIESELRTACDSFILHFISSHLKRMGKSEILDSFIFFCTGRNKYKKMLLYVDTCYSLIEYNMEQISAK